MLTRPTRWHQAEGSSLAEGFSGRVFYYLGNRDYRAFGDQVTRPTRWRPGDQVAPGPPGGRQVAPGLPGDQVGYQGDQVATRWHQGCQVTRWAARWHQGCQVTR